MTGYSIESSAFLLEDAKEAKLMKKNKKKIGRKTKLTPKLQEALCNILQEG